MGLFDYTPMGQAFNLGSGKGPVASLLGLSSDQGAYYQPTKMPELNTRAFENAQGLSQAMFKPKVQDLMSEYGKGGMSYEDLLSRSQAMGQGDQGDIYNQMESINQAAVGPATARLFASQQVQRDPITGQLFGQGGALDRAGAEEKRLASQGYKLTPEDYEAYGQASGNVARLFGQQEQGVAQDLASRGLAGAGSGAAIANYAGLGGNKNEMLAKAQTAIADQRMQNTMQRLNATRQFMSQLGSQAENAIGGQQRLNMGGVASNRDYLNQIQNMANDVYGNQLKGWGAGEQAMQQSMEDQRAQKGHSLFEGLGQGLMSSSYQVGSAPGKFVSSAAGAAGKSAGSGSAGGAGGAG